MLRPPTLVLACALLACSGSPHAPRGGANPGESALDKERKALVLPPAAYTASALSRVDAAAEAGDAASAWVYAHYLLDVFDYARFMEDKGARTLLFAETHTAEGHGDALTDQVLDVLLVAVDRVARFDRLHAGAHAARVLLTGDRRPPSERAQLFARMAGLKGVARGRGPLAANAIVRLAAFCGRAFRDAVHAPMVRRSAILSTCLYPLYDSDPEPYFAKDPARRPPEPAWSDLATGLGKLTLELEGSRSRIAPLAKKLKEEDEAFLAQASVALPTRRDPIELGAPLLGAGDPYEWTPLVFIGDGSSVPRVEELAAKIQPVLEKDARGRVALAAFALAPASALLHGAHAALQAGAAVVEILIGYEQQLKPPPGDYWSGRTQDGRVIRAGTLSFALGPMGSQTAKPTSRATPRAHGWDPARAALRLHLLISAKEWQLVAPSGSFPALALDPSRADAKNALRAQLERLRRAFPDEDGLILVPDPAATVTSVAEAAEAARYSAAGDPLFSALALSDLRPSSGPKGDLAERVARRSVAQVAILPDVLFDKAPAVRLCYLDALDRVPKLKGTLELVLSPPQVGAPREPKVTSGPSDLALRQCVLDRVGPTMRTAPILNARVQLSQ